MRTAKSEIAQPKQGDAEARARLSLEEKRVIDERVAAYRQNPSSVVSWTVAEDAIRKQHGL